MRYHYKSANQMHRTRKLKCVWCIEQTSLVLTHHTCTFLHLLVLMTAEHERLFLLMVVGKSTGKQILPPRDGNSSQRLGLESHLSRIHKDLGLDLDSWTADSRLDLDSWLVRLVKKSFGIGVYMNVSLRETGCLKKKFRWYFIFILPPYNAY